MTKSKKRPVSGKVKDTNVEADRQTVQSETAHLPDRDQLFDEGARAQPPRGIREFRGAWSGDTESRVEGTRDLSSDAVRDFEKVPQIHGADPDTSTVDELNIRGAQESIGHPTLDLSGLSEPELRRRAAALGIPGRDAMNPVMLVAAIKEALEPVTRH